MRICVHISYIITNSFVFNLIRENSIGFTTMKLNSDQFNKIGLGWEIFAFNKLINFQIGFKKILASTKSRGVEFNWV